MAGINAHCNIKQLNRLKEYLGIDDDTLFAKCDADPAFAKTTSMAIAKEASRQGSLDEVAQLEACKPVATSVGVNLTGLNNRSARPLKAGGIEYNVRKRPDHLKSFDARIDGRIKGYITQKITEGKGGHQDNVIEEIEMFCNWASKFGEDGEVYIALVDMDVGHYNMVRRYDNGTNVRVFSHIEFQEWLLSK
tara:strand:- start:1104 stop:1679 length:576 start_codon:yes stop_codon:yes gene_type:complete